MTAYFADYNKSSDISNTWPADATHIDLDYFSSGIDPYVSDPGAATVSIWGKIHAEDIGGGGQDVDTYAFEVLPDDVGSVTLTFDVDSAASGGLDSYIWLRGPDMVQIAYNDDNPAADAGSEATPLGGSLDSFLTFTPVEAGTYYISIRSFTYEGTGNYILHVSQSGGSGIQNYGDGTLGNDDLYGDSNGDPIADTIHGYAGNDWIGSGNGNDTVYGGDGADVIDGGPGHDKLYGDDNLQIGQITYVGGFFEGPGDEDTIYGGDGSDDMFGGRGDDKLYGGLLYDDMDGGDGADLLDGGADSDTYRGGSNDADTDIFVIRKGETHWGAPDLIHQMENAGAAGGDIIRLDKMGGPVFWQGYRGNDFMAGMAIGGAGNGVNDGVYASYTGQSFIAGIMDVDDDGILTDTDIWFRVYDTTLIIPGDFAPNQVIGPSTGDASDQTFTGTKRSDYITAGAGNDKVSGGGGIDLLMGEVGADKLFGEADGDSLDGGSENDRLDGGAGRDHLQGGTGRDVLIGRADADVLAGGAGADRFVYTALADSGFKASTRDVITDFNLVSDRIDLSAIDAIPGGGDNGFSFLTAGDFTGAGQVRVASVNARADALVMLNTDADADAEATILLLGIRAARVDAGDFVL